jgi:DNA (cytosine-5)-methyltransferase 1
MKKHKYPYEWKLQDANFTKDKGTVFSCFACGGGSTMGYKLAGFDVIGMNEIDPKMADCYITNHNPKYPFIEDIRTFKERKDLPKELYNLDILDGSPPCSSFSVAGNREKDWGKQKKFREGQSEQVLDTLFFDFLELAKELQPKIVVAENVKGILMGSAKDYAKRVIESFNEAGYEVQEFVLDASNMGVPQKRERVFFIGIRKDLATTLPQNISTMFNDFPLLNLVFTENKIPFGKVRDSGGRKLSEFMEEIWSHREFGDSDFSCTNTRFRNKPNTGFGQNYLYDHKVSGTLTSHEDCQVLFDEPRYTSVTEACKIGSYPLDYDFRESKAHYLIGMSVPPVMVAQIASRLYEDWLSKINKYERQGQF